MHDGRKQNVLINRSLTERREDKVGTGHQLFSDKLGKKTEITRKRKERRVYNFESNTNSPLSAQDKEESQTLSSKGNALKEGKKKIGSHAPS